MIYGRHLTDCKQPQLATSTYGTTRNHAPKLHQLPTYPKSQTKIKNACILVEQRKIKLQYIMLSITFQLSKASIGIAEVNVQILVVSKQYTCTTPFVSKYPIGDQPNVHAAETQNQEEIYQRQHHEADELNLLMLANRNL